ncbi:hypothetical protein [Kitasatospora terrestris]|uniref:hypothetical protein n=1 Tax=Kitasatospora terrestris TaxID=258051 RepID=UPI0031ECB183
MIRRRTAAAVGVLALAATALLTACGPNSGAANSSPKDDSAQVQQYQQAVDAAESAAAQAEGDAAGDE